jgi:hypothetical protein
VSVTDLCCHPEFNTSMAQWNNINVGNITQLRIPSAYHLQLVIWSFRVRDVFTNLKLVIFLVAVAVIVKILFSWVVIPRIVVGGYRIFEGTYCLHLKIV